MDFQWVWNEASCTYLDDSNQVEQERIGESENDLYTEIADEEEFSVF